MNTKRLALSCLGGLLLLYAACVAVIVVKQRDSLYRPVSHDRPDIALYNGMRIITVETADGLILESWYAPPKDNKGVIILFHGQGLDIAYYPPKAKYYREQGYGTLLAEYRGYGGNEGTPTEDGLYTDARAHLNWLIDEQDIPENQIILHGTSLGSAVAVKMATEYNVKGVILDAPFKSTLNVAQSRFPLIPFMELLMWDQYRSDLKINTIKAPIFIGTAGLDVVVPAHSGDALYELARRPKANKEYPNSTHMGLHEHGLPSDALEFIETNAAKLGRLLHTHLRFNMRL